MTQSTREEIIKAHEVLAHLIGYDLADAYTEADKEEVHEHEKLIRKFLPPLPRHTMAEVEWDDDKHYLAEAANPVWGTVVMLNYDADRAKIQYICYEKPGITGFTSPENLTPTGYQCTLTEVQDD